MTKAEERLEELICFRSLMELSVSTEDVRKIWGKKFYRQLDKSQLKDLESFTNENVNTKISIAKKNVKKLLIFNWVKFIGISGSVGAGFAKEDDDIDLFIVVRNNTMWLYRGLLTLSNLFHHTIRTKRDHSVKDKFCINLICEERDLIFEKDIFNFHELMYVKPLFNPEYLEYIYSKNKWLLSDYLVKSDLLRSRVLESRKSYVLAFLNIIAFYFQFLFMLIANHYPEFDRLKDNNSRGRIEFFEIDYKRKMLKNYLKRFKSIN